MMGTVKDFFWDEINVEVAEDQDRQLAEIASDYEGHTEHELRETLAEAIQVLGKARVEAIINEETAT